MPPKDKESESDEQEIILLAQKGAKEGTLTSEESDLVTNALHLNNLKVEEIVTPRTVMFVLDESSTVEKVFEDHPNIPFARIPLLMKVSIIFQESFVEGISTVHSLMEAVKL